MKELAPQAGFEPATLRLTVASRGFLMTSYLLIISYTVNTLGKLLAFAPVTPIDPIFEGEGAQKGAQYFWCLMGALKARIVLTPTVNYFAWATRKTRS